MNRILRLPVRGQLPHESLSSQPSHGHGKLGGKSAAEDRTVQAFPDLSSQNAIISDACGGAITLGDQSFIVQAVPDDDCGVAAGQTRSLYALMCNRGRVCLGGLRGDEGSPSRVLSSPCVATG